MIDLTLFSLLAKSDAEKAGYVVGTLIGFVLLIAIPVFLIISIVKTITSERKTKWIVSLVISSVLSLGLLGLMGAGVMRAINHTARQKKCD